MRQNSKPDADHTEESSPLPRYRRAPELAPPVVLTARDLALLEDLWRFGFLTTSQIETLRAADPEPKHRFISRFPLTRRLKLLFHHRYVRRLPRPLALGSQEPVYVLDHAGARILSQIHGEITARAPSRLPKAVALDHLLEVAQVRVALAASQDQEVKLLEWLPGEKVRFRVPVEGVGQRREVLSIVPDAGIVVRIGNHRHFAFLEVDRGTETQRILAAKCQAYAAYWSSGGFARDFSVPAAMGFWVLFVVPASKRAQTVLKAVATVDGPQLMFRVALSVAMQPERIIKPVWKDGDSGQACRFYEIAAAS